MESFSLFWTICFSYTHWWTHNFPEHPTDSSIFSCYALCASVLLSAAVLWSFWLCSKCSSNSLCIPPLLPSFHFLCVLVFPFIQRHPAGQMTLLPKFLIFLCKWKRANFCSLSKFSLKNNNFAYALSFPHGSLQCKFCLTFWSLGKNLPEQIEIWFPEGQSTNSALHLSSFPSDWPQTPVNSRSCTPLYRLTPSVFALGSTQ